MPILAGSAQLFVGGSPCHCFSLSSCLATTTTAVDFDSIQGLFATFRMPTIPNDRLYIYVPTGAVVSQESQTDCEEYRFAPNMYWISSPCSFVFTLSFLASEGLCQLVSPFVPRSHAMIRFTCDSDVTLDTACVVTVNSQTYSINDLQVSGSSLALPLRDTLEIGKSYDIVFTQCGIQGDSTITVSSGCDRSVT